MVTRIKMWQWNAFPNGANRDAHFVFDTGRKAGVSVGHPPTDTGMVTG